jgi:hypothetical protein
MIKPTRKVTADDSTSVMSVKRRDTDDNQAFGSRWRKVRTRSDPQSPSGSLDAPIIRA